MHAIKVPRLIQRCMFHDGKLEYDDMGISEFEWGPRPNSLRRIFSQGIARAETIIGYGPVVTINVEMVAGRWFDFKGYQSHLQRIATDETMRFPAMPRFRDEIELRLGLTKPREYQRRFNVWFDVVNDVLWTMEAGVASALVAWLQAKKEMWEEHPTNASIC